VRPVKSSARGSIRTNEWSGRKNDKDELYFELNGESSGNNELLEESILHEVKRLILIKKPKEPRPVGDEGTDREKGVKSSSVLHWKTC